MQPKRVDINLRQRALLDKIQQAPESLLEPFEVLLGEVLGRELTKCSEGFWNPRECSSHLGVSPQNFEKYIMHYLRVIRRTDESAVAYRERKRSVFTVESPENKTVKSMGRMISTRILLWCVMGPTRNSSKGRGESHHKLRELVVEKLGVDTGSKMKIKKHDTQVTHFEVRE